MFLCCFSEEVGEKSYHKKMSHTFILKGRESVLTSDFFPPIKLDPDAEYSIGLTDFEVYNSIPNIDNTNNLFYYDQKSLIIPTGAYEIGELESYLQQKLGADNISITPNMPTQQTFIKSKHRIDFSKPGTIGKMLGFGRRILDPGQEHKSDQPVMITNVLAVLIECNLVTGSFINGIEHHTIHMFPITTPPGYKIIITPSVVLFFKVISKLINNITISVTDQDGKLLNLRNEILTVRLHLKKENYTS